MHNGVPVFRYPIPQQPTRDEAQGKTAARGAEHFHRWLGDVRPDVLHAHTFVTGLALVVYGVFCALIVRHLDLDNVS